VNSSFFRVFFRKIIQFQVISILISIFCIGFDTLFRALQKNTQLRRYAVVYCIFIFSYKYGKFFYLLAEK